MNSAPVVLNGAPIWNKVFDNNTEAGHTPLLVNENTLVSINEPNQAGKVPKFVLFFL